MFMVTVIKEIKAKKKRLLMFRRSVLAAFEIELPGSTA